MASVAEPVVLPGVSEEVKPKEVRDPGYLVICWDDPINTMQYVTHVFSESV